MAIFNLILFMVLTFNNFHNVPVKDNFIKINFTGYLGRYLRRRMAEQKLNSITLTPNPDAGGPDNHWLDILIDFLGHSLGAINEFIEGAVGDGSVTVGPRILLQCPLQGELAAQQWFIQLWNHKLVPYMRKVVQQSEWKSGKIIEKFKIIYKVKRVQLEWHRKRIHPIK